MKWISVEERLPDLEEVVLVTGENLDCELSYRHDYNKYLRKNARTRKDEYPERIVWKEGCCCNSWAFYWTITHWIPIPEKPMSENSSLQT